MLQTEKAAGWQSETVKLVKFYPPLLKQQSVWWGYPRGRGHTHNTPPPKWLGEIKDLDLGTWEVGEGGHSYYPSVGSLAHTPDNVLKSPNLRLRSNSEFGVGQHCP